MKAASLGLREITVHFGTFDFGVDCLVGPYTHVERYVAWKFEDSTLQVPVFQRNYEARGRFFYRHGYCPIVWIPRRPVTAKEHGTLAHEMFHAIAIMMEWANIPMSLDTHEVFCHALGHGVSSVLQGLAKR